MIVARNLEKDIIKYALTGTVIEARYWRHLALDGGLAEEVDGIGVGAGRVRADPGVRLQALAAAHQQHLLGHRDAAFSFDRLLQLRHAVTIQSLAAD